MAWLAACAAVLVAIAGPLRQATALDITGYSAAVNDRFTSGFPTAPVPNTGGSFVGLPYDWSGVAWSTSIYAASSYKGFAMLSPVHFLTAQHYEYPGLATSGVRLQTNSGTVVSQSAQGVDNLGYGFLLGTASGTAPDLALGTLTAAIAAPTAVARYGVLDLYTTSASTTYSVYDNLPVLAYGRGSTTNDSPRTAATTVVQAAAFNGDPTQTGILTLRTGTGSVQLVEGDSGSPLLNGWTNPNGGSELAVLGLNSGVSGSYNLMSFLAVPGAMANANAVMTTDGYALRVVGNPSNTWVGSSSTSIGNRAAWGLTPPNPAPSDKYVLFSGTSAGNGRAVTVDTAANLRGLFFKSTGSGTLGFTFSGASTLTVGRGGITNYDGSRQTFTAAIALGDDQYWDVGPGGVTAGAISTGGNLLEIAGSGTARITGAVSGTGGIALTGSRLELSGSSSYTGATWVHAGRLVVDGHVGSSSGVTVDAGAALGGSGIVAAIGGAGSVDPGNSPGILTGPSVDPSSGLDFNFEFTKTGSPIWSTGTASGNDVLRLTSLSAPFAASLTAANDVNVFLDVSSLSLNDVFRGGFFTDRDAAFLATVQGASWNWYLRTPGGTTTYNGVSYSPYTGPYSFSLSTVAETATFAGGSEAGYVTQFLVVPEPAFGAGVAATVLAAALRVSAGLRRKRRRIAVPGLS